LQNVVVGVNHQIQISDTNSTPRTYSLLSAPAGATIDPTTGFIAWNPTYAQVGGNTITVRATNAFGYRDLTTTVQVYFTGPVQNLSYISSGANTASAIWTPPADLSNISGYIVQQEWKIGGRSYSRTFRVDGALANRIDGLYIPTGTAFHGVRVYAIDTLGRYGLGSTSASLV
jgi:hypothetical protein